MHHESVTRRCSPEEKMCVNYMMSLLGAYYVICY